MEHIEIEIETFGIFVQMSSNFSELRLDNKYLHINVCNNLQDIYTLILKCSNGDPKTRKKDSFGSMT